MKYSVGDEVVVAGALSKIVHVLDESNYRPYLCVNIDGNTTESIWVNESDIESTNKHKTRDFLISELLEHIGTLSPYPDEYYISPYLISKDCCEAFIEHLVERGVIINA